jgi:hypothetical protein
VITFLFLFIASRHSFGQLVSPEGTASVMVTVDARHPWVDSGLEVRKGEQLSFEASGTIQWGATPRPVNLARVV